MKTLQYYWEDGSLTVFEDYTIDDRSTITNVKINHVMSQSKTADGYSRVSVRQDGHRHTICVARALVSTFIGPPPTLKHTAEHKDGKRTNDTLENIIWEDKPGQRRSQTRPVVYNNAFIIVKDDIEHTAREWYDVFKMPNGKGYNEYTIKEFAREQKHGFRYKVFDNIPGEVWRAIPGSKNKKGEWFISNKNRVKYKTPYAENVMTSDQLSTNEGYPVISIKGKKWKCHKLSMLVFRPREYAAKLQGDIILHKDDNKLDFNPFRLRWGTPPENGKDAHRNRKYDGTKSEQKPVASYIDDAIEEEHESLADAVRFLQINGCPDARLSGVQHALKNDAICYGRTWKIL
ncbi:hypothetical protein ATCVNTS1_304R [Acanthocystis turfacea Chlorella virus NTS-1]|nr:hypothetical protein ATCVNTS1_304R [Acanthocystis turfacea Chlorella virus NTS-1]